MVPSPIRDFLCASSSAADHGLFCKTSARNQAWKQNPSRFNQVFDDDCGRPGNGPGTKVIVAEDFDLNPRWTSRGRVTIDIKASLRRTACSTTPAKIEGWSKCKRNTIEGVTVWSNFEWLWWMASSRRTLITWLSSDRTMTCLYSPEVAWAWSCA